MSCRETCCHDCAKQKENCSLARKCYGKRDPKCVNWVGEIPCSKFRERKLVEVKLGEWQEKAGQRYG